MTLRTTWCPAASRSSCWNTNRRGNRCDLLVESSGNDEFSVANEMDRPFTQVSLWIFLVFVSAANFCQILSFSCSRYVPLEYQGRYVTRSVIWLARRTRHLVDQPVVRKGKKKNIERRLEQLEDEERKTKLDDARYAENNEAIEWT